MKRFREDDLWVVRERRTQTGVAKSQKTNRVQLSLLILLALGLLLVAIFITIALISQHLTEPGMISESIPLPEPSDVVPGILPETEIPPLVIALNRIEWSPAFEALADKFETEKSVDVEVLLISGYEDYYATMKNLESSNEFPDLFLINGPEEASLWSQQLEDLSEEPWVGKTPFALVSGQQVVGFPIDLAGSGLIYNKSLLDQAGIDPATLTNRSAWGIALQTLEKKKKLLGINAPLALALNDGRQQIWSNSRILLNIYLSSGMTYKNSLLVNQLQKGEVEKVRFQQFADYLDLLFRHSEPEILLQGTLQDQYRAFSEGRTVFTLGSSDLDPSLQAAGVTFERGFIPFGAYTPDTNGIFAEPTGWLVLSRSSPNSDLAQEFLQNLANQDSYQAILSNKANVMPAMHNQMQTLGNSLQKDLFRWNQAGHIYDMSPDQLPLNLGADFWGPLFEQLAAQTITSQQFVERASRSISDLAHEQGS